MVFKYLICLLLLVAGKSYSQENFVDFTVDPSKHHIEVRLLDKTGKPLGSFKRLKKELEGEGKELIFAMNAGIYMQNQMPLGLYIENGKVHRKLNTKRNLYGNFYLQPNGVFLLSEGEPYIIETSKFGVFSEVHKIQFATQSGPMLLINGEFNQTLRKYDTNKTIRNAVCIDSKSLVTFSISKSPVSFYEISQHLSAKLGCLDAIYMDGAISGIYTKKSQEDGYIKYGPMLSVISSGSD